MTAVKDGPPLTAKGHRAQETRWRFLTVRTLENLYHHLELKDRTAARAFAEWLMSTGQARRIELTDMNQADSGFGWANPD